MIALWTTGSAPRTKTSIAEPAIAIVEAVAIAVLSYFEHVKSNRPSILLNSYLVLSIILDIALTRTFWIRERMDAIAAVFTVSLICKAALLIAEEIPKKSTADGKHFSRERSSGVISRSLFWWLNKLFYVAARDIITVDDLGTINEKFDSVPLLDTLEARWKKSSSIVPNVLYTSRQGVQGVPKMADQ